MILIFKSDEAKGQKGQRKSVHDDSNFWKQCSREFMANAQAEREKKQMPEKHELAHEIKVLVRLLKNKGSCDHLLLAHGKL